MFLPTGEAAWRQALCGMIGRRLEHSQGLSDTPESQSKNQAGGEGFPQRPSPKLKVCI